MRPPTPPGSGRGDGGAGTVLLLGVVAVAAVLAAAALVLGQAAVARHRADVAADLAALAAADVLLGRAAGEPCARAARVVIQNGGDLRRCRSEEDGSVSTEVRVRPRGAAATVGDAVGRARAGPAPAVGEP